MKCTPIHWFSIIVSSLHLPALTRSGEFLFMMWAQYLSKTNLLCTVECNGTDDGWICEFDEYLHLSATVYVTQAGQAPQYVVTSASPNNAYSTGAYVVQPPQLTMQSGYNNPAYSTQDNPYAYPKY